MKAISTEELRKRLANYSPESDTNKQQQDQEQRDAALVKDIATLSTLSKAIEADTNSLAELVAELKSTHFAITLPDEVKASMCQCCEDAANMPQKASRRNRYSKKWKRPNTKSRYRSS